MPDTRKHRGPHPDDARLFAPKNAELLRRAVSDYSMLLTAGYAPKSSLKLVGDRFALTGRQRLAVMRSACSDRQLEERQSRQLDTDRLKGRAIVIDGYNLLITTESALSGAAIFIGRDRCMRDLSGVHGSYRKVTETIGAIELIAKHLNSTTSAWHMPAGSLTAPSQTPADSKPSCTNSSKKTTGHSTSNS